MFVYYVLCLFYYVYYVFFYYRSYAALQAADLDWIVGQDTVWAGTFSRKTMKKT